MRKTGALLVLAAVIASLAGCKKNKADPGVAVTSIFPVYDLVRRVGGDKVKVQLLLRPGASAHDFNPSTRQMRQASGAGVAFIIGLELDEWTTKAMKAASGKARIVRLGDRVKAVKFEHKRVGGHEDHDEKGAHHNEGEHHHEEGKDHHDEGEHHHEEGKDHHEEGKDHHEEAEHHHDHDGLDPHIWLSVPKAIAMVDVIAEELTKAQPDHAKYFAANAAKLKSELGKLHQEIQATTKTFTKRTLVTFHGSFGYFAAEYGLTIAAVIEPYPGRQPSAAYLKKVLEAIKDKPIAALFTEPQLEARPAELLAKEAGLPLRVLDPVGGLEGRDSYEKLMRFNLSQLAETMK